VSTEATGAPELLWSGVVGRGARFPGATGALGLLCVGAREFAEDSGVGGTAGVLRTSWRRGSVADEGLEFAKATGALVFTRVGVDVVAKGRGWYRAAGALGQDCRDVFSCEPEDNGPGVGWLETFGIVRLLGVTSSGDSSESAITSGKRKRVACCSP
jgi:hypothetical protein